MSPAADRQRVAVVTGGGGGIGAAIAEQLARSGAHVVTVDPLVSVDGTEQLANPDETTAGRIVAAGGSAQASSASVTDREGVAALFAELVESRGGVDAVVNVAGITRQMSFVEGGEDDWRSVLSVHLDGWLNVLGAALPVMAAQGHGHVLGVTSGSGWRPADTGAYGCAKRAVANLTWQLGRDGPAGVAVNAISPIAMTRMVAEAMARHRSATPPAAAPEKSGGGLVLGTRMPSAQELGPMGAHLVGEGFAACRGQVIFLAGSELAVVDEPRLLEVIATDGVASLPELLEVVVPRALASAEAKQATTGGSNLRFAGALDGTVEVDVPPPVVGSCAVVADDAGMRAAVVSALEARGIRCRSLPGVDATGVSFEAAAAALAASAEVDGPVEALVVAPTATAPQSSAAEPWRRLLAEHEGIVEGIAVDSGWSRAVADESARTGRPLRMALVTDAVGAGGRSRAQAAAHHARAALGATDERVSAFAVALESVDERDRRPLAELVAHLVCGPETAALSGAELAVGRGTIGLRSHPRVSAGIAYGGTEVPSWLDSALGEITR